MFKPVLFIFLFLLSCSSNKQLPPPDSYFTTKIGDIVFNDYVIKITSSPSGAKIELNNDLIGESPLKYRLNDRFKAYDRFSNGLILQDPKPRYLTIKAYPISEGQFLQTKRINLMQPFPRNIYFDLSLAPYKP